MQCDRGNNNCCNLEWADKSDQRTHRDPSIENLSDPRRVPVESKPFGRLVWTTFLSRIEMLSKCMGSPELTFHTSRLQNIHQSRQRDSMANDTMLGESITSLMTCQENFGPIWLQKTGFPEASMRVCGTGFEFMHTIVVEKPLDPGT